MAGRISVLFFDMDGTLIDAMPTMGQAFGQALADVYDIDPAVGTAEFYRFLGFPPDQQMLRALESLGRDPGDLEPAIHRFETLAIALEPRMFPEVPAVLQRLHGLGYTLVVSSNGPPAIIQQKLATAGIGRFFTLCLGRDVAAGVFKGEGHFRVTREHLGLTEAQLRAAAVLIGDGLFDMRVAREAGITAIGRLTGDNGDQLREAGAGHLIRDLTELEPLLANLGGLET